MTPQTRSHNVIGVNPQGGRRRPVTFVVMALLVVFMGFHISKWGGPHTFSQALDVAATASVSLAQVVPTWQGHPMADASLLPVWISALAFNAQHMVLGTGALEVWQWAVLLRWLAALVLIIISFDANTVSESSLNDKKSSYHYGISPLLWLALMGGCIGLLLAVTLLPCWKAFVHGRYKSLALLTVVAGIMWGAVALFIVSVSVFFQKLLEIFYYYKEKNFDKKKRNTNSQNAAGQGGRGRVSDVYMRRTQVSDDEPNDARPHFQDWYYALLLPVLLQGAAVTFVWVLTLALSLCPLLSSSLQKYFSEYLWVHSLGIGTLITNDQGLSFLLAIVTLFIGFLTPFSGFSSGNLWQAVGQAFKAPRFASSFVLPQQQRAALGWIISCLALTTWVGRKHPDLMVCALPAVALLVPQVQVPLLKGFAARLVAIGLMGSMGAMVFWHQKYRVDPVAQFVPPAGAPLHTVGLFDPQWDVFHPGVVAYAWDDPAAFLPLHGVVVTAIGAEKPCGASGFVVTQKHLSFVVCRYTNPENGAGHR